VHVLVNATSARLGGGITVLRNLLPALVAEDGGENRYTVVALDEVAGRMDPGHERIRFVPFRHRGMTGRLFWEQLSLPLLAATGRAEVLLSPANLGVLGAPLPQVLMFQNMAPFDPSVCARTEGARHRRLSLLRWLGIASAHAVKRLVFISRFAQRSILPQVRVSAERSDCIYLGRDPAFTPSALMRAPEVLGRLGVERPYVLSVSHFYQYKNFVELVRGFALARPSLPAETSLVIAGGEHEAEYAARVRRVIAEEHLEGAVRLLGEVPYESLPPLYAAASLFVFPSSCENFPNILVEGMASGAPTLASRLGPMPEIAGDGAAYFDPFDPADIARSIVEAWRKPGVRDALRAAGLERAERYRWNETARGLLDVLARAAHPERSRGA
jgi:glycosyltransferase involved in cell wall biosynthesis